ncbi:MAG: hypothetical protein A3F72_07940 [Bacteroidetes bacterium RIFCSPLOWO2_12_FULL_35_15]|nr:MAG: hypothetical protein A3F72_07940 [Bacteroidetes bacterium RIFCSPLOWO2_12_FULL_35_15]
MNGKEKDNEVSGNGNSYDYGFRIYIPRLGRFLSVDPLTQSYPWYTPYQFAGNKPIVFIDIDGLEEGAPPKPDGGTTVAVEDAKTIIYKPNINPNVWGAPSKNAIKFVGKYGTDYDRAPEERVKRAVLNNFANSDVFYVANAGALNGISGTYFYVKNTPLANENKSGGENLKPKSVGFAVLRAQLGDEYETQTDASGFANLIIERYDKILAKEETNSSNVLTNRNLLLGSNESNAAFVAQVQSKIAEIRPDIVTNLEVSEKYTPDPSKTYDTGDKSSTSDFKAQVNFTVIEK